VIRWGRFFQYSGRGSRGEGALWIKEEKKHMSEKVVDNIIRYVKILFK
jgi:hypothetical protein